MIRASRPLLLAALAAVVAAVALGGCGGAASGSGAGSGSAGAGGDAATMSAGTAPARRQVRAGRRGAARAGTAGDPWTHLRALATIGAGNRGTRAAGTPGGVATENLIASRLKDAGWAVRFERVSFPFFDERRPPRRRAPRRPAPRRRSATCARCRTRAAATCARPCGSSAAGARTRAAATATGTASRAGRSRSCGAGSARSRRRRAARRRAGAAAIVIEDRDANGDRGPVSGTLGAPGIRIPTVAVDGESGAALARADGPVRVRVDAVSEQRAARNVVAELPGDGRRPRRDGGRAPGLGAGGAGGQRRRLGRRHPARPRRPPRPRPAPARHAPLRLLDRRGARPLRLARLRARASARRSAGASGRT